MTSLVMTPQINTHHNSTVLPQGSLGDKHRWVGGVAYFQHGAQSLKSMNLGLA